MSVTVERIVIEPGDDAYVEEAWAIKEQIRKRDGVLKQRRGFFVTAYRQATTHAIRTADRERMIGFASTRDGGYLLFLAVDPVHQGEGFGRELIASVAAEHDVVTCHARVTNERALDFYDAMDFEIVRRVSGYYEDNGDAYLLRLGEESSVTSRLVKLFTPR